MLNKGDKVRVRADLQEGLGVVKEQLAYAGDIQEIDYFLGYAVMLKGNPFAWKQTDLERIN